MKNKNLRKKCISKRAKQIKNLLETNISYKAIAQQIKQTTIPNLEIQLSNSKFSKNKKHYFPYGWESAKKIIDHCQHHGDIYTVLLAEYFQDELNIHSSIQSLKNEGIEIEFEKLVAEELENSRFVKSNLSQTDYFQSLEISNWTYEEIVISAVFFHIEHLYEAYSKEKEISKHKPFFELECFSALVALLLLNPTYGKQLFDTLQNMNLFVLYPDYWLSAFASVITSHGHNDRKLPFSQQNRLQFLKEMTLYYKDGINFHYILFYLKPFSHFIPPSVIHSVFKYCLLTKSVHVLYYILEKYRIHFNSLRTTDIKKKQYFDFLFTCNLEAELNANLSKFSLLKNLNMFFNNTNFFWLIVLVPLLTTTNPGVFIMATILPSPGNGPLNPNSKSNRDLQPQKNLSVPRKSVPKKQKTLSPNQQQAASDTKWIQFCQRYDKNVGVIQTGSLPVVSHGKTSIRPG